MADPSAGAAPGPFLLPGEPRIGVENAFVSLNAGIVQGQVGLAAFFTRPRSRVSMQVSFTQGGATVKTLLEGTIDGVNWFVLATFDTGAAGASGDIVTGATHVVAGARARNLTLSAGSSTATILGAGPQSG